MATAARELTLHVELLPTLELVPHPRNPRTITPPRLAHLKRVLAADPEMLEARPLIRQASTGYIVAGNQRHKAAVELVNEGDERFDVIPTVTAELDDSRAIEWAIRDNEGFGERDDVRTAELLLELQGRGRSLDLTGMTTESIDAILAVRAAVPKDPDAVPPVPKKAKTKPGEIVELGDHRLLCGDTTDPAAVAELVGDRGVALAFTSPPYADLRDYSGDIDLTVEHLATFLPAWAPHCDLIAVNLGIVMRAGAVHPYWDAYIDAARGCGLKLLAWNVWNRDDTTNLGAQRMMFPIWHEWVFVFGAKSKTANRTVPTKHGGTVTVHSQRERQGSLGDRGASIIHSRKRLGSVVTGACLKGAQSEGHPAMFPAWLPSDYMKAVTHRDEHVADPFAGAGTTLIAAEDLGRCALLMEIDPAYCDVIRRRYADHVSRPELRP